MAAVNSTVVKPLILGVAAGSVAGLLGIGGGIIVAPGLVLLLGVSQREASGTSIATIVASSGAALTAFGISGNVNLGAAVPIFIGAAVGAVLGARIASRVPERFLTAAFAVVLLVAGIRMLV